VVIETLPFLKRNIQRFVQIRHMFGDLARRFRISGTYAVNGIVNGPDRPDHTLICDLNQTVEIAVIPHR